MKFRQDKYWKERGKTYFKNFLSEREGQDFYLKQEDFFENALIKLPLENIRSVLEIGAGFGRMTKIIHRHLPKCERYICLDISEDQLRNAHDHLAPFGLTPTPEFLCGDFTSTDFGEEKFDLVIATELFYHFPPEQIILALNKAQEKATSYFIFLDALPRECGYSIRTVGKSILNKIFGSLVPQKWWWPHNYISLLNEDDMERIEIYPHKESLHALYVVVK